MKKQTNNGKVIRTRSGRQTLKEALVGYVFVSPWILGCIVFLLYPLILSVQYSVHNIRFTPKGTIATYIGYQNFTQVWMEDPEFPQQLIEYLWKTIVQAPIIVVFALIIAMLLNGKIKFRGFFRLVFFLPVIIVSGPVMNMLVSEGASTIPAMNVQAIVAALDDFVGMYAAENIGEIFSNMIMILWYSGVQILIFLSALQKIYFSLFEAAKIDGGSSWECFWKITLPTIRPMILLNTVYTIIFLSSNEQNPIITMIQTAMFSGTKEKGYGYASAMAWMYTLTVGLIVILFALILKGRKDKFDNKIKIEAKKEKKQLQLQAKIQRRGRRNAKRRIKQQQG